MPRWRCAATVLATLLVLGSTPKAADEPPDTEIPKRSELVEQVASRLTQIDVSVSGPLEVITNLVPEDFTLKINRTRIREFLLDQYCSVDPSTPEQEEQPSTTRPVSYLLYYDQPHLTLPGRQRALDLGRELVRRLIRDGSAGMIVSSARRLAVIEDLTTDGQILQRALDRLENDREQWDFFATEESSRVAAVIEALNRDDDVNRAISIARTYHRDERFRSEKALRRLEMTLVRLADLDSSKVVIYFADTMRSNAGEHFLTFFGNTVLDGRPELREMSLESLAAALPYDRVVNIAAARGIRFYPIQARGLATQFEYEKTNASALTRIGSVPASSRTRSRDAESTLANLARETGGRAFITGRGADKIARSIVEDHSCMYTISFDPAGFSEDAPLRAAIKTVRDDITLRSKGRVVVESESTRLTSRLLSAFSTGRSADATLGIRANLVPIGFRDGAYSVLLQVSIPATRLPGATWELGASTYSRDKVLDELSGRLSVARPGVPMILEQQLALRPGPHQIAAVARETNTDFILSDQFDISWPDPNARPITCGPVSVLQPMAGAYLRDGDTRTFGSFARAESDPLQGELPTALMSLICRNRRRKNSLAVERTLEGHSTIEFPQLQFELGAERCAQVRDVIPAGSLGGGYYRYIVRAKQDGELLDELTREFFVSGAP